MDLLSGRGLPDTLNGADVVVNLTNAGMFATASGGAVTAKDGAVIARTTYRQ